MLISRQALIRESNLGGCSRPLSQLSVARLAKSPTEVSGVLGVRLWFCVFHPFIGLKTVAVFFLQECPLVSSGIVIAIKLGIQFIDKNVRWCLHTICDSPFSFCFELYPYCIYYVYIVEYCLILRKKHSDYTESIGNSRLNYISKQCRKPSLSLACIRFINRSFELI